MANPPQNVPNNLAVDSPEVDSALGDDEPRMTESLQSDLRDPVMENGRSYHRFESTASADYPFPEDEIEQERLDLQHEMFRRTFRGKLFLSPMATAPHQVLDLGTGTGIWAIQMADINPQAHVLGIDLSPIQPLDVPPNVKFEVADFNDDWTFTHKFDFIHARALMGSSQDFPNLIRKAYDQLKPGGYLEMTDILMPFQSDDGTMIGTDLETWSNRMVEACGTLGIDTTSPSKYRQMMLNAGFGDVQEQKFRWPVGPWPKDPWYRDIGMWCWFNFLDGLEGFTLRLWTNVLGMSFEETQVFLVGVRKNIRDRRVHSHWPIYTIYGRKPGGI